MSDTDNVSLFMNKPSVSLLMISVNDYIEAPTQGNREKLMLAAEEYRESWILEQATSVRTPMAPPRKHRSGGTTYDREIEVTRKIGDIPVKLDLQERNTAKEGTWWTLSWRTKYSPGGSNRRFYVTQEGCWTIPAALALEMMREMEALGGLDSRYFSTRGAWEVNTLVSNKMSREQRVKALESITGTDEDWGHDPFFVIVGDYNSRWQKVMIVNTQTNVATFRSITTDPEYMPKKVLRPDSGWWLDNSMMDADVQQTREFYAYLKEYLDRA